MTPPIPTIQPNGPSSVDDNAAMLPLAKARYEPPWIKSVSNEFSWPIGPEGFVRSGSATLGIHKYLGDTSVVVQIVHADEARIEMTGTFPGRTSQMNMTNLLNVLTDNGPKSLFVPGVFNRMQRVFTDTYSFTHAADDRTHSIDYNVTFVRTTVGGNIPFDSVATQDGTLRNQSSNAISDSPRSTALEQTTLSERTFTVTDGTRTLRQIAAKVYGDQNAWKNLVWINRDAITTYNPDLEVQTYSLSSFRFPVGAKIVY